MKHSTPDIRSRYTVIDLVLKDNFSEDSVPQSYQFTLPLDDFERLSFVCGAIIDLLVAKCSVEHSSEKTLAARVFDTPHFHCLELEVDPTPIVVSKKLLGKRAPFVLKCIEGARSGNPFVHAYFGLMCQATSDSRQLSDARRAVEVFAALETIHLE